MRVTKGAVKKIVRASAQKDSLDRDAGRAPAKRAAKLPRGLQRSEHDEQRDLFAWINLLPESHLARLAFAVPNGARTSMSVAKRLKAEGLRAGVPDIVLPVARTSYFGLFVEMKRASGVPSDVNDTQREWHNALRKQGYAVVVAYGCDAARAAIEGYLNGKMNP